MRHLANISGHLQDNVPRKKSTGIICIGSRNMFDFHDADNLAANSKSTVADGAEWLETRPWHDFDVASV